MEWSRDMEKPGVKLADAGRSADRFQKLVTNKGVEPARVAVNYTEGIDYGAMKVATTVTISCDQTEESINEAGELAFRKALELTRDGWSVLQGKKV